MAEARVADRVRRVRAAYSMCGARGVHRAIGCPLTMDVDDLAELTPELTVVGSYATDDLDGRFPS
jgi:hypothetical protein